MNVSQLLQTKGTDVFTSGVDTTINEIVETLGEKKIGAVVVTDDGGAVQGIVSERDVVRGLRQYGPEILKEPVSKLMTRNVITCGLDDKVDRLMQQMTEHRIRHLPVIDDGALAGLISIGDAVKFRVDELENETNMLREYIEHA